MSREVWKMLLDMDSRSLDSTMELFQDFLHQPAPWGSSISLTVLEKCPFFLQSFNRERSHFLKGPRTLQTSLRLTVVMVASVCQTQ